MSEPVLSMAGVTRMYGKGHTAVVGVMDIDLEVRPGELVAITGRSGSGKSTLLNLAGGLDQPTAGSVRVSGTDLSSLGPRELAALRRKHIGVVFQHDNLLPTLTAAENVSLPLELDAWRAKNAHEAAMAALEAVGIAEIAGRFPDELSGGEQQRVAIARGLVGGRGLLLADEPTGALDEVTGEGILALLRQRCEEGTAALMVTHDSAQAAWADRVVRLRDGRVESVVAEPPPTTGRTPA